MKLAQASAVTFSSLDSASLINVSKSFSESTPKGNLPPSNAIFLKSATVKPNTFSISSLPFLFVIGTGLDKRLVVVL